MNENDSVLNGRYKLVRRVPASEVGAAEVWEATDGEGETHTLKISPYPGESPAPEIRRVWDNDLRVMYRLSSSPGADDQLVVMKDAGIDRGIRATVLVYEGWDRIGLARILEERDRTDWLSVRKLKERAIRQDLWRAFLRLACGLKLLHDQRLIHRNVSPQAIWGRRGDGPESLRLGGFDWSARLGHEAGASVRTAWSTPPELALAGYSFAYDWYGFGTTLARCFFRVEHLGAHSPADLALALARVVAQENPCQLTDIERNLVRDLTAADRLDRQQTAADVIAGIEEIVEALDLGNQTGQGSRSVLLFFKHIDSALIEPLQEAGFMANTSDPFEAFNPYTTSHQVRLKEFLADQLRRSSLVWRRDRNQLEIRSGSLYISCRKWLNNVSKEQSWAAARVVSVTRASAVREPEQATGFGESRIEVEFIPGEIQRKVENAADYMSWESFAPRESFARRLGKDSEDLQQFLHASNQFEALKCDAELFRYRVVHQEEDQNGLTRVRIVHVAEERSSRSFFNADKELATFLRDELESGKRDSDKVLLTDSDSLFVSKAGSSGSAERFDVDKEQWQVDRIDPGTQVVELSRVNRPGVAQLSPSGYLRTRGHYGQIRLIERRKQSIERLTSHAYLMRAMSSPALARIDVGDSKLPRPQIETEKSIDGNKVAIIKDTLRTRPMYALQGPPGTGKSTLVAHLLRQILEDDPMAQILVTAKDHDAVDVLRAKVDREAYKGEPRELVPLAVRLSRRDGRDHAEELVAELAARAHATLADGLQDLRDGGHGRLQEEWRTILDGLHRFAQSREGAAPEAIGSQPLFNSLRDLTQRGASITYCTTSSGDLEELAKGSHSFDWTIVEEAGKTHGFDLALPLQAGHRWLLLGDHMQLRPFLYDQFVECFDRLEDAIQALDVLGQKRGNGRLIDIEWLKARLDAGESVREFKRFGHKWLASFETIFQNLARINGVTREEQSIGAAAGLLTRQYRMPPVVGDLISHVFYNDEIGSGTIDDEGRLLERHRNPFVAPERLANHSLVWLDVPWRHENRSQHRKGYSNLSERQAIADFLSAVRIDPTLRGETPTVAVLTPYNWQKKEINAEKSLLAPMGCRFGSSQDRDGRNDKAYTVDSFQGNEADVVIVSMVRNELQHSPSPSDIEFISEPNRLNVMLSRPVRLLVIVGCWDYLFECVRGVVSSRDPNGEYKDRKFGPFKRTLEVLAEMFKDGRALRVSTTELLK